MSEKNNLVKELINKIQANHSLLTMDESDKFRIIFDHSKKNNYITHEEVIWLQQIVDCKLKTED